MIYAFKKRKSFSEDARRSRSILNGTVDLHVQAADHHRNIVGIGIQHPVNVAEIWPDLGQSWPERPDPRPALAREAGSQPAGRTDLARSGQPARIRRNCRNPATFAGIR
jgi:hypothetical protein